MATIYVANYGDGTATKANFELAYAAASIGDTIQFPLNGSSTWTAGTTIGKAVSINGNGTTLTAGATLANGFFYFAGFSYSGQLEFTGFTFNLTDLTGRGWHSENVDLTQFRFHHNTFHHGNIQVEVGGCLGVFDHNTFYNGNSAIYPNAGTRAQADASWVSMAAGTSGALFFENNQFIYNTGWLGANAHNACFDTYNGGKFVVRYNTFLATDIPGSWTGVFTPFLSHGNADGYWQITGTARRGQSVFEMYNNAATGKRMDFGAQLRGSANLIYDNRFVTQTAFTDTPAILAYEEEQWNTDSFTPLRTGWPAEDQVHNTFIWNNFFSGGVVYPNPNYFRVSDNSTGFIQLNRDYWLHAPESSGGYEYFSGANGASNTYPTDGVPSSGTMLFSATGQNAYYGYVPYTYPHPLTGPFYTYKRLGGFLKLYGLAEI